MLKGATLNSVKLRRYTIVEIDSMRQSLYKIEYAAERYPLEGGNGFWYSSGSYAEAASARTSRVEDQLRTYMIGGIGHDELASKAEAAQAEQKEWYEQERKRIADRQLQAEYGPRL